jgi:hypothetical protein
MTTTLNRTSGATRFTTARTAAFAAAAAFVVDGVVTLLADGDALNDHTTGAGAVSEVTAGLAFLACATSLSLLTPVRGWRALLWWLAPLGLGLSGILMVGVPIVGSEPPSWIVDPAILASLVGLIAAGILGTKARLALVDRSRTRPVPAGHVHRAVQQRADGSHLGGRRPYSARGGQSLTPRPTVPAVVPPVHNRGMARTTAGTRGRF